MKHKVIAIKEEARNKVISGMDLLVDAVKLTLGPSGLNAISGIRGGTPRITNDGASIANEISSKDELEDLGIRTVREATAKTNDEAGDGTTTAAVLTQAITKEMIKQLPQGAVMAGKKSLRQVLEMVDAETKDVIEKLKGMSTPIESEEALIEAVKVSVENDDLAKLIGETQWKIGQEGTIVVEETAEMTDSVELIPGIRIDNGFGTAVIVNNVEKQTLEVSDAKIILTNHVINTLAQLAEHILNPLLAAGHKKVIILARAFSDVAIKECLKNHEGQFLVYPINAPYVNQKEIMLDLAAVTGATYFDTEERDLADMNLSDVGFSSKILCRRHDAVIAGGDDEATQMRIAKREEKLEAELVGEVSQFAKKALSVRLSQLKNGCALLKVGATSDTERKYKKDKVDDAVNSARSALQEGVVAGAGQALKAIAEEMPDGSILKKALSAPYDQIMKNTGEVFEVPEWVKDPVKVVRIGLEKASSVAKILATTAIAINHENEAPRYVQEAPNQ